MGSVVIIQQKVDSNTSVAVAAGRYGPSHHAEMIAVDKALKVERTTDSSTSLKIHSDSRHALKKLATEPADQDDMVGCKIWQ